MESATTLIHDLAIVTLCAGAVSLLFAWLRLPLLLGYLLAGLLVGPHLLPFRLVENTHTLQQLSQLGVVFLMFYVGMTFDLRRLKQVLGPCLLAVLLQTAAMVLLGLFFARTLGLNHVNGLFLGGILAVSSTMVTIQILQSEGHLQRNFAQLAIGILILDDIVAIVLLVILTGVGVTGKFAWDALWQVTFLVGVFVVLILYAGKLATRSLMRLLERFGNAEVILLAIVGVVLGVGELAERMEFSIALGAFLAGAIVSQSTLSKQIENATEPFRSLFSAVFFVTVGMSIIPGTLVDYWLPIVVLATLVITGKAFSCWLGTFLSGQNPLTSFRAAASKAQIGEFSFVIASLGESLHVTSPALTSITVGVSLATILSAPLVTRHSDAIYKLIGSRIPRIFVDLGTFYRNFLALAVQRLDRSAFLKLIRRPLLHILGYFFLFNGVLVVASLATSMLREQDWFDLPAEPTAIGVWLLAALIALPPLTAIIRNLDAIVFIVTEAALTGVGAAALPFVQGRMKNIFHGFLMCAVLILGGAAYLSAAMIFLPTGRALTVFVLLIAIVGALFWRHLNLISNRLEYLFIESFNEQQSAALRRKREALEVISERYPWPVQIREVTVPQNSALAGRRIAESGLRERTGASIIALGRDGHVAYHPGADAPLFPGDKVVLLGEDAQLAAAEAELRRTEEDAGRLAETRKFEVDRVLLNSDNPLVCESLAGANLRLRFGVSVIGIQRKERRIIAPPASEILRSGDVLMVVGNRADLERFRKSMGL